MNSNNLKAMIENLHHPMLVSVCYHNEREFDIILKGAKKNWETRFSFNKIFPFSLPVVILLEDKYIGLIPHVNINGVLCIDESDSIIVNYRTPLDIISYTIESAIKLLDLGLLKINRTELTDEYEGYLQPISGNIPGNIIGTDSPQKIYLKLWYPKNSKKFDEEPVFIYGDGFSLPDRYSNFSETKSLQTIKSVYIPIEYSVLPPQSPKELNSDYISKLFSLVGNNHLKQLNKIICKFQPSRQFYILLGIPRSIGVRSLILFRLKNKKPVPHPFMEMSSEWEIKPYLIKRHDKEYLLERGGANFALSNINVAIIGCGSVGSEIALILAKSGVGNLTLIDHDILEIDNIYRHRLGGSALTYLPDLKTGHVLGFNKAEILSLHLERELPHVRVNAIPKPIEEIIDGDELKNAKVIISAVGSPSMNLFLNRKFKALNYKKIIYCWNEAASVGGHALFVDLDSSCYECQFWNSESFSLVSSLNLVEPEQQLTKNLTGCAGVFTPFSYMDSSQTANIAGRLCIEAISGSLTNKVVSWKNPNVLGINLTDRYLQMNQIEEKPYQQSTFCKACQNEGLDS